MSQTPLSDIIQRMFDEGASWDQIIVAVRAMETALHSFYAPEPSNDVAAKRREWDRKRKASLPKNWVGMTAYVFRRDDYACTYCGDEPAQLHCDHIIPLSRGGLNEFDNLATSCPGCNTDKGSKLLSEWNYGGFGVPRL